MKKNYYISICLILLILFAGCGKNSSTTQDTTNNIEASSKNDTLKNETSSGNANISQIPVDTSGAIDETPEKDTVPLKVTGTQLTDSSGKPVQLRGISSHGLSWFPDYINNECFAELKSNWNVNVIRLAMYTAESGGYCTGGNQEDLKNLVCSGIEYAAQQNMYVIVDWHILSDNNPNTYIEESKNFFHEISAKYADSDHILYEICNEPNGDTSWSEIKSYAETIIPIIRANDSDAIIIVGTPNWCQYVDQAAADPITGYDNIMYSLHFYAASHKDDLRNQMASAIASGLPIFVTEYGICDASGNGNIDIEQANLWVSEMNRLGISYVAWNLSNKNESSAILDSSCTKTNGFLQEDLSTSGEWLFNMLTGQNTLPTTAPSTSIQPPQNEVNENTNNSTLITTNENLEISLSITGNWESNGVPYYQYSISLKNTGTDACSGWAIEIPCDSGMLLSDSWNGIYSVAGNNLHISAMDYNSSIPAGGSISDIGFIVYCGKLQI